MNMPVGKLTSLDYSLSYTEKSFRVDWSVCRSVFPPQFQGEIIWCGFNSNLFDIAIFRRLESFKSILARRRKTEKVDDWAQGGRISIQRRESKRLGIRHPMNRQSTMMEYRIKAIEP